ncbi:hypothetical protein [Pseudooctadecabacter sp.]|uniref:hypothetical protein n=1 Tax=Pseudooctadecabacter sp. TaxID=1966338 RepID=UPI0035C7E327
MKHITDVALGALRLSTGAMMVLTGMQPLGLLTSGPMSEVFPVILTDTNVLMIDVLLRLLFVIAGLGIMFGIRTRLLSSYILSVLLLEAIYCIHTNPTWTTGHVMLVGSIMGLSLLIAFGGGHYALIRGGWRRIPL